MIKTFLSTHLDASWFIPQIETMINLLATQSRDTDDFIIYEYNEDFLNGNNYSEDEEEIEVFDEEKDYM